MGLTHSQWFALQAITVASSLNHMDFLSSITQHQPPIKQQPKRKAEKQQQLIGMCITVRAPKRYFIIVKMFYLFLCIDSTMVNSSHIFNNPQAKILEQDKELDIILIFVGILFRKEKEPNIKEIKLVEISNMPMLLRDL